MPEGKKNDSKTANISPINTKWFNFKGAAHKSGNFTYWYAYDYMRMLGYKSLGNIRKTVGEAWDVCVAIDVDTAEDFEAENRCIEGVEKKDIKLSLFACYLIAMAADITAEKVNEARKYYSQIFSHLNRDVDDPEGLRRILIHEKVLMKERSVFAAASKSGLSTEEIRLLQNAGCHGLYGMHLTELKRHKGLTLTNRSLLDFMCEDELLANYFRLNRLEIKLKSSGMRSQRVAENEARVTGGFIRSSMIKNSGFWPENFELVEDIRKAKASLQQIRLEMKTKVL